MSPLSSSARTCRSQIRQGIANNTKGTAFVVYEDVMDAKSACDKLNGFNFQNRYLVGKFTTSYFPTRLC
jgi:pre-mRNA branch site protein p14